MELRSLYGQPHRERESRQSETEHRQFLFLRIHRAILSRQLLDCGRSAARIALEPSKRISRVEVAGVQSKRFWRHFFLRIPIDVRLLHRFVTPAALFECISDNVRQVPLASFLSTERVRTSERIRLGINAVEIGHPNLDAAVAQIASVEERHCLLQDAGHTQHARDRAVLSRWYGRQVAEITLQFIRGKSAV